MVAASIYFRQPGGAGTSAAGFALLGDSTCVNKAVTVGNGDDTNVSRWTYEMVATSDPASTVPLGVVQDGAQPTFMFTPDKKGGYLLHLVTTDKFGNVAEDYRVFQVAEASGRLIVPFRTTEKMCNWTNFDSTLNVRGWADYQRAYDKLLDGLTIQIPIFSGLVSTNLDSSTPLRVADKPIDRTKLPSPSVSVVKLYVELETTDGLVAAHVDLVDVDGVATGGGGVGSVVAGSSVSSLSTSPAQVVADLSTPLKAAAPGRFRLRLWSGGTGKFVSCSYAYFEVT